MERNIYIALLFFGTVGISVGEYRLLYCILLAFVVDFVLATEVAITFDRYDQNTTEIEILQSLEVQDTQIIFGALALVEAALSILLFYMICRIAGYRPTQPVITDSAEPIQILY